MDDRQKLMSDLKIHKGVDEKEAMDLAAMIDFLEEQADCFQRSHQAGHFTGSALLLNHHGDKVLLNHHRSLDCWLQFGGHADGDPNLFAVAWREVQEESGFSRIEQVITGIFDVDIHPIPHNEKRNEPAHLHYDVRYLFRLGTDDDMYKISPESIDLRWCDYDEALALVGSGSVARMLKKWQQLNLAEHL